MICSEALPLAESTLPVVHLLGDQPAGDDLDLGDRNVDRCHRPGDVDRAATGWEIDAAAGRLAVDGELDQRTDGDEGVAGAHGLHPVFVGEVALAEVGVGADAAQEGGGGHLVGAGDQRKLVAEVLEAIPVGQAIGVDLGVVGVEGHHLDGVDQPQHDVGRALRLRVRGMGQHHQTALADAALGPLRHRHFQRIADGRLGRAAAAERVDHLPAVAEERDVPEHLHPVLGADPHQELAVAAEVARAEGGAPVEVADVAEHLAPLAGQQVDDVDPLRLSLQQRHLRAEEVDVGIGGDPAALAPRQRPLQLEGELLRLRRDLDQSCGSGRSRSRG